MYDRQVLPDERGGSMGFGVLSEEKWLRFAWLSDRIFLIDYFITSIVIVFFSIVRQIALILHGGSV